MLAAGACFLVINVVQKADLHSLDADTKTISTKPYMYSYSDYQCLADYSFSGTGCAIHKTNPAVALKDQMWKMDSGSHFLLYGMN